MPWHKAQTFHIHVIAHLSEHLAVPFRPHPVEYHPYYPYVMSEMDESRQQRSQGIGSRLGIHHKHHGQLKHPRHLGRRALVAVVPVKKTHHAFHDAHIRTLAVGRVQTRHMLLRSHERVEIHTWPPSYRGVEFRIDVVGTALERLHLKAMPREERHQSTCHRRLARPTGGGGYHKLCCHGAKVEKKWDTLADFEKRLYFCSRKG